MSRVVKVTMSVCLLVLLMGVAPASARADSSARPKLTPRAVEQIYLVLKVPDFFNVGKRSTWAVRPSGKGLHRIRGGDQDVAISPNGRFLYCTCTGGDSPAVDRMKPDGSHFREVLDLSTVIHEGTGFSPPPRPQLFDISVSGVGTAAYGYRGEDGMGHIEMMSRDGSVRSLYTTVNSVYADISPDGRKIVFEEYDASTSRSRINLLDVGTGSRRTLYANPPTSGSSSVHTCTNPPATFGSFSLDGRKVMLVAQLTPDCTASGATTIEARIVDLESGATDHVVPLPENGSNPTLSPDGTRIAFVGFRSANFRDATGLFVINSDGSGLHRLLQRHPMPGQKVDKTLTWGKVFVESGQASKCVRRANRAFRRALRRTHRLRSKRSRRRARAQAARRRKARLRKCRAAQAR